MEIQTTLVSQATDIEKGEFYKKTYFFTVFSTYMSGLLSHFFH